MNGFDYMGSLTYRKNGAGLQLESAGFGDGVIRQGDSNSSQQEVNYFLADHLGSVRVTLAPTLLEHPTGVIERQHVVLNDWLEDAKINEGHTLDDSNEFRMEKF